jgi:hypothetical protein
MKKIFAIVLAIMLALSLVACGGKDNNSGASGGGTVDVEKAADNLLEEAVAENAFSEAAAAAAIKKLGGVEESAVTPDWAYAIDEASMRNYGDIGAYGHGSLCFVAEDGELSDEEYLAWARKVYDATAEASDDGKNINGYNTGGEGADPNGERSFDEAMGIGSDAWIIMQGWCYRYNDTYLWVNIEQVEDPNKESEVITDDEGKMNLKYYYNAAAVDISVGLQKSFDETMKDVEDAFEEHGDEIEDALRNAAN